MSRGFDFVLTPLPQSDFASAAANKRRECGMDGDAMVRGTRWLTGEARTGIFSDDPQAGETPDEQNRYGTTRKRVEAAGETAKVYAGGNIPERRERTALRPEMQRTSSLGALAKHDGNRADINGEIPSRQQPLKDFATTPTHSKPVSSRKLAESV